MHIYIRTGSNENTGINFNDGTKWEVTGSDTGFTHTTSGDNNTTKIYTQKPRQPKILNTVPFGDRSLAALVLAQEELDSLDPGTEIYSLTWLRSNNSVFHDLKTLFMLDGTNREDLLSEIQKTLAKHLQISTPGCQTEINITSDDLERVELASGQPFDLALLDPDKPQGFTITSEDGETTKTYEIPDFLRQNVCRLPHEQRTLALYALALEKLHDLPHYELISGITYLSEGLSQPQGDGNDLIPSLPKYPTGAGTLQKYLWNTLATYTKRV